MSLFWFIVVKVTQGFIIRPLLVIFYISSPMLTLLRMVAGRKHWMIWYVVEVTDFV